MKELQTLINALDVAVKAGVYSLQDTNSILQAISSLGEQLKKAQVESLSSQDSGPKESPDKPEKRAKKE